MGMNQEEVLERCPHLLSPAHLAMADTQGKWKPAPHLQLINKELVEAWRSPNSRLAINVPFQHGKSLLCSIYFPAWVLLLWPETRVALASYEETFACNKFGGPVRDLLDRYGPALGVNIKDDSSAKGDWEIEGYGGGMVCKGRGGALTGRPADLLILDDLIKNGTEAQSPTVLETLWDWYNTVAYSRLGPTAPVISIGTRWCPKDWFGMVLAEQKTGGEKYRTINIPAIAEANDPLGRQPGEALFPERVPLKRLERIRDKQPRWFKACWQGRPQEDEGLHFQPAQWRKYTDTGDAWRVKTEVGWKHYRKCECAILVAVDWAQAGKKQSNKTAIVTAGLTPDGFVLILGVINKHLRYEENAPALAELCREINDDVRNIQQSNPDGLAPDVIVASDDDMLSDGMQVDCQRYRDIPPIKRLPIRGKAKLIRAQPAIIRSQNGMFLLPEPQQGWYEEMKDQLSSFTGEEGNEDDIPDCFGILGRLADDFNPGDVGDDYEPILGSEGFNDELWGRIVG